MFELISTIPLNMAQDVDFEVVNKIINFKPKIRLSSLTEYTVDLSSDILGVDGSKLATPVSWRFTTLLDVNSPALLPNLISPAANASNVDTGAVIQASFDEPILLSSLDNSFILSDKIEGDMIDTSLDYDSYLYTVSLKANSCLNLLETYIATVTTDVADLLGRDDSGNARSPQVVMNKNGSGFSIWKQFDGNRYNIQVRRYDVAILPN